MSVPTRPSTPTEPAAAGPLPDDPFGRAFLHGMPGVTELILVRHGQQAFPKARGDTAAYIDPPLSETGVRQAEAVGLALAGHPVDAVYCSHLVRAHDTGKQVARHHDLEPVVVESLREIEIFRDLPDGTSLVEAIDGLLLLGARNRFARERMWDVWPYTETGPEFRHRVWGAVEGILASHPAQRVVVACHGGVINAVVREVLGVAEDMFFRPGHASVHRLAVLGERRAVWSLNETHHLAAVDEALVTY